MRTCNNGYIITSCKYTIETNQNRAILMYIYILYTASESVYTMSVNRQNGYLKSQSQHNIEGKTNVCLFHIHM